MKLKFIKLIAILFIIVAVASIIAGVLGFIPYIYNYIGIASALGTLAGAILVFSTLEMQIKSLNEEKCKNEIERFDSRFYPILSSFRTDASKMEIIGDCLSPTGTGKTLTFKGEKAFTAAKSIINGLNKCLVDKYVMDFDKDEFDIALNNYSDILDALNENLSCIDDIDKTEKERREYIRSNQVPYLIYKWGITKEEKKQYQQMDSKARESFLLDILINQQPTTFSKYILSLRFILQIIKKIKIETEKKIYYQHLTCLIGKEELEFLKYFSEFDIITDIG